MSNLALAWLRKRLYCLGLLVLALVTRWRWRNRDQTGDTWQDLDRFGKWKGDA